MYDELTCVSGSSGRQVHKVTRAKRLEALKVRVSYDSESTRGNGSALCMMSMEQTLVILFLYIDIDKHKS